VISLRLTGQLTLALTMRTHFLLPLPRQTVSQCHSEAVAEESLIYRTVNSLDSSPFAEPALEARSGPKGSE